MRSILQLHRYIEKKRSLMIRAANKFGLNADITIQYSQELDELLNQYRKVTSENKHKKIANLNI